MRRNDGASAYNLAVVVDDAAQGIGEVVRGADLLDSTPRQLWLGAALGLPEPSYAHVPLVLGRRRRAAGEAPRRRDAARGRRRRGGARGWRASLGFEGASTAAEMLDGVRSGAAAAGADDVRGGVRVRAVGVVLALIGGFGIVVTMGAFVLSGLGAPGKYCEDEPTVGDALQFALPFGLDHARVH